MIRILKSDLLKLKRKWIWFLVFLGPFGVIGLQGVNYGLRYDWLVKPENDHWRNLLNDVNMLLPLTLMLGIAIISSMTAGIEHQQNAWKQVLALPVTRMSVFTSKFILNLLLLAIASLLVLIGTIILGLLLKFGIDFPLTAIAKNSFYPLLTALPFLALQTWLSITMKNQSLPLTTGILLALFSMYLPLLLPEGYEPLTFVQAGVGVGMIIFLLGAIDFMKRDVK
ncbi:ABC transporter permease [Lederbergia lenta]|uniref:ABC transporter permease n=1 Tax=Lederbergia lenta TaxID=1467 RepID=UPI00203D7A85|nr:ABC transporter permease [Lederbergia lenta]MCM3112115.1 ABC transporter permease [Lederbergia lenta]